MKLLSILFSTLVCVSALAGNWITDPNQKWPDGIIPYEFADNHDGQYIETVKSAMDEWSSKTPVSFRPRQSDDFYFVQIIKKNGYIGATYPVGRNYYGVQSPEGFIQNVTVVVIGDCQGITMPSITAFGYEFVEYNNFFVETLHHLALHELGHVIGLYHEHQRDDRDSYIRIQGDNYISRMGVDEKITSKIDIPLPPPGFWDENYGHKMGSNGVSPYDYQSVMHYHHNQLSGIGVKTHNLGSKYSVYMLNVLEPVISSSYKGPVGGWTISQGDINAVFGMYGYQVTWQDLSQIGPEWGALRGDWRF